MKLKPRQRSWQKRKKKVRLIENMVMTIMICSGVSVYVLVSLVVLLFATYFDLPKWAEYAICIVCFPLVAMLCLVHLINNTMHCYDDDDEV